MILRGAALLSAVVLVGCSKEQPAPAPELPALSKQGLVLSSWKSASPDPQDRLLLAHATAKGKTEAMVMVATRFGSAPAVATAIAALGADIPARVDEVGYLRVRLPLDRLSEVSALPDVLMAHIDGGGAGGLYTNDRELIKYPQTQNSAAANQQQAATLFADIEALLRDAADPAVNVLTRSHAGGRFPEAGQDLFALMADRAVEVYGKPLLVAAGDAGRVESINGAASSKRALAIGAYASANTLVNSSSRGPAADGGAKPDLLMPGSQAEGTSAATASAAEAVLKFMASAKEAKLPADARHVSWALRMSARHMENHQSHEQGFGLMNIERATDLLQQLQARQFELPDIQTRAPVKTYLARFLPEPGVGQGLYEREGWLVGQTDRREITLIRQNGAATPLTYSLQWRGNDGTFQISQQEVILPLNVPVSVPVEIAPKQVGIHSAHLFLVDKASDLPAHAVLATVVASEQFTAANGYQIQHREQSLPELRPKSYFLEVPPNVASLRVDLAVGTGQVELVLFTGGPRDAGFNLAPATKLPAGGKPTMVVVPNPPPGVYELLLVPSSLSKEIPSDVAMTASIRYVDPQLGEDAGEKNSRTLWMTNIYAPLLRSSLVAEVGAQRVLNDIAGASGMRAYNIIVAESSSSLRVAASATDSKARSGIYLYDCVDATCELWGSDVFTKTSQKALVVPNPRAGVWKAVIDVGTPGAAFKYTEIMTNSRFGSAQVSGEEVARRTGARWNQKVGYQLSAATPFGYQPVGVMDVIDPGMEAEEQAAPYGDWEASGDARNRPLRPVRLATQVIPLVAQ